MEKAHRSIAPLGKWLLYALLAVVVALPYLGAWYYKHWCDDRMASIRHASFIVVDKEKMILQLIDYRGETLSTYGISCGKRYGDKRKPGDNKTPEGIFHLSAIQDASAWTHDFGDGAGEVAGAYGPWFLRLEVPGHKGIGIHGTHKPESIGTRDTEGCIRLHNSDLQELKQRVFIGMTVIVLPSLADLAGTAQLDSLQAIARQKNAERPGGKRK